MQTVINIICIFGGAILLVILMYIVSQVQMLGWIKQIKKFLNKELEDNK